MRSPRLILAGLAFAIAIAAAPSVARAGCDCGWCDRRPYGRAAPGTGGGYGAKDPVKTAEEARKRLESYFSDESLVIGKVTERPLYFEASVNHKDGRLVDRVIVDKRSGRIRSIL